MVIVIKKAGFEDLLNSGDYYLKALIIGDNGAGKTPFAAQWPDPLFALCENGHMSLAISGTPYADVKSSADMQALLDMARIESRKPITSRRYKTLVIDTIDSYQKILIQERLRETKAATLNGWADWGWLEAKMASLIETLKGLAMHTVVLMHTKDVEEQVDDEHSRIVQRARMKGDIKESVYDNFPLIGLVENFYAAGEGEQRGQRVLKRQVRWQPDPKHPILRDQSTKLPRVTEVNFTTDDFQVIFDAIGGGLDDLPASEEIETLEVPEDAPLPDVVEQGGAVEKPALPKAAAKKAAAKKTAAKKTAAKKAEPAPVDEASTPVPEPAPESAPEPQADAPAEPATDAPADDPWQPPLEAEPEPEPEPDEAALNAPAHEVARQAKAKAEAATTKPAGTGRLCGSQPPTFAGKYEPAPGCGREIASTDVASKVGLVRHRTYLCGDCIAVLQS